jgi:hypothetical protein
MFRATRCYSASKVNKLRASPVPWLSCLHNRPSSDSWIPHFYMERHTSPPSFRVSAWRHTSTPCHTLSLPVQSAVRPCSKNSHAQTCRKLTYKQAIPHDNFTIHSGFGDLYRPRTCSKLSLAPPPPSSNPHRRTLAPTSVPVPQSNPPFVRMRP